MALGGTGSSFQTISVSSTDAFSKFGRMLLYDSGLDRRYCEISLGAETLGCHMNLVISLLVLEGTLLVAVGSRRLSSVTGRWSRSHRIVDLLSTAAYGVSMVELIQDCCPKHPCIDLRAISI